MNTSQAWMQRSFLPVISICILVIAKSNSRFLLLPLLIGSLLIPLQGQAAMAKADQCEGLWHKLTQKYLASSAELKQFELLMQAWVKEEANCKGSGIYEYRLGVLHDKLGDKEKAVQLFTQATRIPSGYSHLPELSLLLRDAQQVMANKDVAPEDFLEVEKAYERYISRYDKWYAGFEHYARLEETIGKYDRAIELAKRAIELDNRNWMSYKVLTVAYAETNEFERSIAASGEAININPSLMGDPKFMLSLAMAYAGANQNPMSNQALGILKRNAPGIENNKIYKKILKKIEKVKRKNRSKLN